MFQKLFSIVLPILISLSITLPAQAQAAPKLDVRFHFTGEQLAVAIEWTGAEPLNSIIINWGDGNQEFFEGTEGFQSIGNVYSCPKSKDQCVFRALVLMNTSGKSLQKRFTSIIINAR